MTTTPLDRRQFLLRSAAIAGTLAVTGRAGASGFLEDTSRVAGLIDTSMSRFAKVRSVGLAESCWTEGFWADRFATCRTSMVPVMGDLMAGTERTQFLENFRVAAGLAEGRHRGPAWNDGDFYKWLEAAAAVFAIDRDPDLDRRMDEAIRIIGLAQRPDGYIHTPVLIAGRRGDPGARPLADRLDFEAYNLGHLLTAGCVHRRATGKDSLLRIAIKAADYLDAVFRDPTPELARNAVCPAHYMGVVELFRETGDPKYRDLARKLIDIRALVEDGTDDNQDRIPFRDQRVAAGHAVRANYLYAGVADVVLETGDPTLLAPLRSIWSDVVRRKLFVTGACGALFDGASPDGSKDQGTITRVHQAYGRDYQLPQSTAHNETCAAIGNVLWNARMLRLEGEAKYADVLELSLLNATLAGISIDGTRFFYTNTLRQLDPMPTPLRWSRERQPFISCFCCPPNAVRTIAEAASHAYGVSEDDAAWVHLYGGSTLDTEVGGGRFRLRQETDYPWDGRVRIAIEAAPDRPIAVRLRVPGWARGARLSLNGSADRRDLETCSYAELRRTWSIGDVVELDLPMPAQLIEANPLVEEARNQVAVRRGPVVYCLESIDLDGMAKVQEVAIPREIALTHRFDPGLLGGVAVLEGRAEVRVEAVWSEALYRELSDAASRPIPIRLIPYFAWGNRGPSEMTVWMPLSS